MVRNIVKEYQSTVDKKEITEAMQELADLIIREGDQIIQKGYSTNGLTYDEIRAKAADIAWEILGNSQAIANESDVEFYDEIKSYLRKMPISLTEESDIADFKDFRKRNFGRLLIKKDGLPIDTVWTELQEAFGKGFFPDDITHPADQLMHLEELLNNMEAVYYNPYEVTMPQNVEACANAIVDKLFSEAVQPVSTYMDQELESMSQKIQQNEADIRQLKKEKDQLLKQNELLSKQSDGVNQYREARTKTQMKNQIRNTAKELGKILNSGTKERNVKEGLREVAGSTLRLAQVLFSDMRMETILYGMDTYAMTDKEKWTLDQYIALASKRDKLKERKQKLLKEASESAQAWLDTEGDRNSLDEQYQKIREKMAPLADKLQSVAERERNRLKSQGMVGMAIDEMASAYKSLEGAEEKYIAAAYDGLVHDRMLQLKEDLKDAYIGDMTMKQMRDVYDIMQMMMSTIRNSNKLFAKSTTDTLVETAEKVTHELTPMQKQNRTTTETGKAVSKFHWNNYKPIYAFLRIGSDTMTKLYENIRKGEETWYVDMEEAKQFRLDTEKKHGFKKWDFDKKFGFTSSSGMDFQLSLQDIMSLYACYKREQALDHIMLGGFVFDPNVKQTVKGKLGFKKEIIADNATAYNVDLGTWGEIVGKLTKEQKAFVDEMQEYLYNTMGGKGNEISVAMYGVKLFREQFYFPLRSAPAYNARIQEQQEGSVKIKNSGFTKETVEHASKPIVLTPFMDVWADHINEMSMYHSFTLPLEDFYRVYNFGKNGTEADATSSTVAAIQNAHGQAAVGYIDQLLKDINAGRMADPRESPMKQLTGRFKKAAVLASMSVTIRQASAGPRAMAYVNPKFFRPELMDLFGKRHTAAWEEMKQHAPIVGIKEMGYFDTGLGRSARDYLLAEEYEGFRENFKAFFKDQSYRDELMGKAPGWVDEVTWIGIWKAVKRETKVKHPELKAGSEAFLQTAGERFTDVIQLTQVYDSVFARSGNMRSGSAAMSDITSFMAEPTTTINMAEFAGRDLIKSIKTKDTKTAKKSMGTFGAITTAIVLDSLLGAIVYAARDDDEDKTYGEKYVENVVSGLLSGVNILTYIPLARDVWTLTQGFDVERADMSLIGSFLDAVTAWGKEASRDTTGMTEVQQAEHSRKMAAAAMKVADGLGSLCGEPTRNLRRDALAVRNLFDHNNWKKSSKASVWDAVVSGWKSSMPFSSLIKDESKSDKLYTAILSGDKVYEDRLRGQYKDESAVQSAIRKGLRDNDPRIRRAAEAMYHEDFEAAWKEAKAVQASGFTFDDVNSAIHSEVKELEPKEEKEKEEKHYSLFSPESYAIEALKKNATMLGTIKEEVMKVAQENGKTQAEAEKSFQSSVKKELKDIYLKGETPDQVMVKLLTEYCGMKADDAEAEVSKWSFQEEYDMAWEDMKQAFVDEEISESQAVEFLVAYGGSEREDAQKTVQKWLCKRETKVAYEDIKDAYIHEKISKDQVFEMYLKYGGYEEENAKKRANSYEFIKNNPECDGITDAAVEKYNQYCAASGVDAGIYYQAYKYIGSLENDKDANGKSISFSAMEKGLAYINNLPISSAQKDAIARSRGWKESNINRLKPWK